MDNNPPDGDDVAAYAASVKVSIPVLADATNQVVSETPWNGAARPGKCALSPAMEMLACYTGDDDTAGFDAIRAHAGQ